MSIGFPSNFSPQDPDNVHNSPKETKQDDMVIQVPKTKAELAYERFKQKLIEAQENYDRMTPSEKADKDMGTTISLKRMNNYALSQDELRWLTTKKKKIRN